MLSKIIGKKLTDIYTVGFVYLWEKPKEFTPDLRWLYFEFEDLLVEFESFEQYSRLRMKQVSEVQYPFESDEDMVKVRSSIIELVLVSSWLTGNVVQNIELLDGTQENCAAAKITLENGQIVFIDPCFLHGIGVGGKEQEAYWRYCQE